MQKEGSRDARQRRPHRFPERSRSHATRPIAHAYASAPRRQAHAARCREGVGYSARTNAIRSTIESPHPPLLGSNPRQDAHLRRRASAPGGHLPPPRRPEGRRWPLKLLATGAGRATGAALRGVNVRAGTSHAYPFNKTRERTSRRRDHRRNSNPTKQKPCQFLLLATQPPKHAGQA